MEDSDCSVTPEETCSVSPEETCIQPAVKFINQLGDEFGLQLNASVRKAVIDELNRKKSLCLMSCGLTGVGKSTLLNGITGSTAFEVGDQLQHQTTRIDKNIDEKIGDQYRYTLTVYDTPGFNDCTGGDEDYIQKVQTECPNVDVLLYCIKVDKPVPDLKPDKLILEKLKAALNPEVWKHCIIVLTFANRIVTRLEEKYMQNDGRIADDFNKSIMSIMSKVHEMLKEIEICPDPDQIPIVPAGLAKRPSLLNDSDYWFSGLFYAICEVSPSDGQDVLTFINADRMKSRNWVNYNKDFKDKELDSQPILPDKTWKDDFRRVFPALAAGIGVGSASGITGATTGATVGAVIGALAIGLPTFGVAAGVGLVLGGAIGVTIGGASGTGIGILVAKAVAKVKRQKMISDQKSS